MQISLSKYKLVTCSIVPALFFCHKVDSCKKSEIAEPVYCGAVLIQAFDSYIKRMSDDGCWGGNLELVRTTLPPFLRHTVCSSIIACANFLPIISECMTAGMWIAQQAASLLKQMNICVHLPRNNASCFLLRNFPEDQSFLHLAYEGDGCAEHYDSVRLPRSDPAAAGGPFELPEIQTSCAQKHGKSIDSKDDEASKLEHVRKVASNATKAVALEALRAADNDIDAAVELATSWSAAGIDDMQCSTAAHDGSNEGNSCSSDGEDRNDVSWAPKQQSIDAQKQQRGRGKTKAARKEAKKDRKRRERMEAAAARTHKSGKGSESSCSHSAQAADTAHRENIVDGATLEI